MIRLYYYLFYRIHRFTKKLGNYDVAFSSMAGLSGLLIFNLVSIINLVNPITKSNWGTVKNYIIAFAIIIFVFNYLVFIYKDKYKEIEKTFSKETNKQKKVSSLIVSIYLVLTLILIMTSMIHSQNIRRGMHIYQIKTESPVNPELD